METNFIVTSFDDYQYLACQTAKYPGRFDDSGKAYVSLGLSGEIGELIEATYCNNIDEVMKELGDIFWYGSQLATEMGYQISQIRRIPNPISVENIKLTTISDNLTYLSFISGKICDKTKKLLRDGEIDKITIKQKLAELFLALLNCCALLNVDWKEVCIRNLEKLFDRKERNMLHGSGGDR